MNPKIFGIGLPKTGTHSLHAALQILGYTSVHYPVTWSEIARHDAANDISVACRFVELDRLYPGAKFILTLRDLDKWLDSCENHFVRKVNPDELSPKLRDFLLEQRLKGFGTVSYDRLLFKQAYQKHIDRVKNYFDRRQQDLLILNVGRGDEWQQLCNFLETPLPKEPFPYHNIDGGYLPKMFQEMTAKLERDLGDILN